MSEVNFAEYKNVWVFAEQRDGKLMNVALELIGEGHRLSRDISADSKVAALLVGDKVEHLAQECFEYGADLVYIIEDPLLKNYTTDAYTKVITAALREYKPEIIMYGATHLDIRVDKYIDFTSKNTTLNTSSLDPNDPDTKLKMTRPAFGGNLMATIVSPTSRPQMSTVRPGVMSKLERKPGATGEIIKCNVELDASDIRTKIVDIVKSAKEMVSLTDADIICSGGRGLGDAKGFELIQKLADKVGGVVGSSRAAVDSGWIDHSHQVGQTGTTVKPQIYFACGISGAIQHLAGMQDSDIIIAINKDADAPIFEVADYGIVGDLYQVIPQIIEEWDNAEALADAVAE